jgi:hypothetical protein
MSFIGNPTQVINFVLEKINIGNTLSYLGGILSTAIGAYIAYKLTVYRDTAHENKRRLLDAYKLLSEILSEFDVFLKSQKYFCYHSEELMKELYYSEGRLEPLQNPDNLLNIENKGLSDFFDINWKNKYYQFIALTQIIDLKPNDQVNEIIKLVDDLYVTREACEMSDQYIELYEYIEGLHKKFLVLNDYLQRKLVR